MAFNLCEVCSAATEADSSGLQTAAGFPGRMRTPRAIPRETRCIFRESSTPSPDQLRPDSAINAEKRFPVWSPEVRIFTLVQARLRIAENLDNLRLSCYTFLSSCGQANFHHPSSMLFVLTSRDR